MGDSFFECLWVWFCSLCVLALVLLARCGEREPYDPYAGCPSSPDTRTASGYAEAPALRNSAPAVRVEGAVGENVLTPGSSPGHGVGGFTKDDLRFFSYEE